jgi:hypothetical protein
LLLLLRLRWLCFFSMPHFFPEHVQRPRNMFVESSRWWCIGWFWHNDWKIICVCFCFVEWWSWVDLMMWIVWLANCGFYLFILFKKANKVADYLANLECNLVNGITLFDVSPREV